MLLRRFTAIVAMLGIVGSTVLSAQSAPSANISGKWTGAIVIAADDVDPFTVTFKQEGQKLTGTAGPNAETQWPITNGRIETVKAETIVTFTLAQKEFSLLFEMKLTPGLLKGTAKIEQGGQKVTATAELKPAK